MITDMNKRLFVILLVFVFISIGTGGYSALEQSETLSDGNIFKSTDDWTDELSNFYNSTNEYCEGFNISSGSIGRLTGDLIGDVTGDIVNSTITPSTQPTSFSDITYLLTWTTVTNADSPYTATAGQNLLVNTTDGAVTINFPASPSAGDQIRIVDIVDMFSVNNCTINPNGELLFTKTDNLVLTEECAFHFMYDVFDYPNSEWMPINFGFDDEKVAAWRDR